MVIAFFRAVAALSEPPMRRVVALSLALAILMRVDFENRRLLRGFTV